MTDDRITQIEQAIATQEAQGQAWTNQSIYTRVGGSYHQLSQYLKARRARTTAAMAILEPEAPVLPAPAPPFPARDVQPNGTATGPEVRPSVPLERDVALPAAPQSGMQLVGWAHS